MIVASVMKELKPDSISGVRVCFSFINRYLNQQLGFLDIKVFQEDPTTDP